MKLFEKKKNKKKIKKIKNCAISQKKKFNKKLYKKNKNKKNQSKTQRTHTHTRVFIAQNRAQKTKFNNTHKKNKKYLFCDYYLLIIIILSM